MTMFKLPVALCQSLHGFVSEIYKKITILTIWSYLMKDSLQQPLHMISAQERMAKAKFKRCGSGQSLQSELCEKQAHMMYFLLQRQHTMHLLSISYKGMEFCIRVLNPLLSSCQSLVIQRGVKHSNHQNNFKVS